MATIELQREYQRKRLARRRTDWLSQNGPCTSCGSWTDLQVDHVDRTQKVTHRIWSWSAVRREAELAKCQVLCRSCHRNKTNAEMGYLEVHGHQRYSHHGCRCDLCRLGHRVHNQKYRKK